MTCPKSRIIILLCFWPIFYSCGFEKNVTGLYRSKFAVNGFFGTRLLLKKDSTFEYRMSGDLIFDTAIGIYHFYNDKVYLQFIQNSSTVGTKPPTLLKKEAVPFEYHYLYYRSRKKLFPAHIETGKKVTKAFGYSKRRKYFLFGKHWYRHKYFLRKE